MKRRRWRLRPTLIAEAPLSRGDKAACLVALSIFVAALAFSLGLFPAG